MNATNNQPNLSCEALAEQDDSENAQEWEAIAAQIDYWRDMDLAYWQWRREQAYQAYLDRQLNTKGK